MTVTNNINGQRMAVLFVLIVTELGTDGDSADSAITQGSQVVTPIRETR